MIDLIKIDEIPDSWTKDQAKIYEIYSEYFMDSKDIDPEAIEEFENLLEKWLKESQIKIVSWNCNGKFREKFNEIIEEDADIYVIQECEDPSQSTEEEYREFAGENYFWTGHLHYKGIGIFAKEDVKLEKIEINGEFEHFIALRVNDSFNLLGVWAMPKYVEMIHDFFDANEVLKYGTTTDEKGEYQNDLWVFDVKNEKWYLIGKAEEITNFPVNLAFIFLTFICFELFLFLLLSLELQDLFKLII